MKREFRILPHAELRAKDGKAGIEGYAAVFNEFSEDLGGWSGYKFREVIMPGAFKDCLAADPDVRCLFNHDSNLVLGRTKAKTLSLREDQKGLFFGCDLPETQTARDLLTSIERGDVDQCSFGFYARKQKFGREEDDDGNVTITRELHKVDLFDVSPVTFPAYPQTSVGTRSLWPDGMPSELRIVAKALGQDREDRNEDCECECPECDAGNCEDCSNLECDDPNCEGHASRKIRILPAGPTVVEAANRERMWMRLELASK
jgi:HK97 family phage prohead protease